MNPTVCCATSPFISVRLWDALPRVKNAWTPPSGQILHSYTSSEMISVTHVLFLSIFLSLRTCSGAVLLSQVIEGSGLNKAVAIKNRGADPANLAEYGLQISFNEKPWKQVKRPLADKVLASGETFVVCHSQFEESRRELCDVFDSSILFNGNDAIALQREGAQVDVFGVERGVGLGGAKGYTIAGKKNASVNHTLLRKSNVTKGTIDWEVGVNQWEVLSADVFVMEDGARVTLAGMGSPSKGSKTSTPLPNTPNKIVNERPVDRGGPLSGRVRMGTFNVEFLFDGVNDPRPSPYAGKPEEAEAHFARVRDYIKTLKADFLNLCEVEDEVMVQRLAQEVGGVGGQFVQGTDRFTGQDVALLSKLDPNEMFRTDDRVDTPVAGSTCGYERTSSTGVSKHYVAKFDRSAYFPFKFAMVGLHLKAIPTDSRSCAKREGQVEVVRKVIAELIREGYEVAVLGDINDYSDKTPDIQGFEPTSTVLARLRDPNFPEEGGAKLRNVMELIPQEKRYSSWWDRDKDNEFDGVRELSQIDHILLTKGLWELIDRAWVDHTAPPGVVSDHWPVMVEFRVEDNGRHQDEL